MNEKINKISIKLLLTIPAFIIGIISAILFVLKPVIELWSPEKKEPLIFEQPPEIPHEFH
jgi:hypothetical protein